MFCLDSNLFHCDRQYKFAIRSCTLVSYRDFNIPNREKSVPKAIETTAISYSWVRSREPECLLGGGAIQRVQEGYILPYQYWRCLCLQISSRWGARIWRDLDSLAGARPPVSHVCTLWESRTLTKADSTHMLPSRSLPEKALILKNSKSTSRSAPGTIPT